VAGALFFEHAQNSGKSSRVAQRAIGGGVLFERQYRVLRKLPQGGDRLVGTAQTWADALKLVRKVADGPQRDASSWYTNRHLDGWVWIKHPKA
jgi:hypothetical protein